MAEPANRGEAAGTHWDPTQYLKFTDHRLRPQLELMDRVPLTAPNLIYDLGCGSGNGTRRLAARWPNATVYGLDNSREMIDKASSEPSDIHWIEASVKDWTPDVAPNLIYSNAALQWVDGHETLFPQLVSHLAPGGCLAVQVPLSWGAPSHRLMREVLTNGGPGNTPIGDDALRATVGRKWVDEPEAYYDLLSGCTESLDIWSTEYVQVLSGPDPVLEWVSGTGLRPILNGLSDTDREIYLTTYRERLRTLYPTRSNGHTLYPFPRLFIVALAK